MKLSAMSGLINFLLVGIASISIFSSVIMVRLQTTQSPTNYTKQFQNWKKIYNKIYANSSLEATAFQNFKTNLINIQAHNKLSSKTYRQGTSSQSDLSFADKKKLRMGFKINPKTTKIFPKDVVDDYPAHVSVNYTKYFPKAKNQKNCAACWSFAAVSVLDYWIRVANGNTSYSEQNLIDCIPECKGCSGGCSPTDAFQYVKDEGISDGSLYGYKAVKQSCKRTPTRYPPVLKVPNVCEVSLNGSEQDLMKIISQHGPVAVALAVTDGFTNYKSGIFYDANCSKTKLDHAVTIVGYGSDTKKSNGNYWIIRNSWGTSWGLNGYGLLARNHSNNCGIASYCFFPC